MVDVMVMVQWFAHNVLLLSEVIFKVYKPYMFLKALASESSNPGVHGEIRKAKRTLLHNVQSCVGKAPLVGNIRQHRSRCASSLRMDSRT